MTNENPDIIRLRIPKRRVAADFAGMIHHLAAAGIQGALLQDWPAVITGLLGAAGTMRIKRQEEALAWELLLTAIGDAFTELANEQPPTLVNEADVKTMVKRVSREAKDIVIPVDFIDHPTNLSPVMLAKDILLTWLVPPASTVPQQDKINLRRRFDTAFISGLYRVLRRDEARYRPLLNLQEHPARPAWNVLEDWRLYRAALSAEYRTAPVFEESFALDQVYVPLNAWHWVEQPSGAKTDAKRLRQVVQLEHDVLAWLRGERSIGRLRLISGGPGSGKSSAMKALGVCAAEALLVCESDVVAVNRRFGPHTCIPALSGSNTKILPLKNPDGTKFVFRS